MIAPAAHPSIAASLASGEARSRSGGWKTWVLGLVIAAIIGGVCHAAPVTLYDSISGNSPDGSSTADATSWLSNQFKTDGDTYAVDSVVLQLAAAPLGTMQVDLYSNNPIGDVPGTFLKSFNNPGTFQTGNNLFTMSASPILAPLTSYWIVVKNAGFWRYTSGSASGPGASQRWADGTNSGAIWNPTDGSPYMMRLTASQASVPEIDPAGLGSVLALVTGAAAVLERRRRTIG